MRTGATLSYVGRRPRNEELTVNPMSMTYHHSVMAGLRREADEERLTRSVPRTRRQVRLPSIRVAGSHRAAVAPRT